MDPVIVHEPTKHAAPSRDNRIYGDITLARIARNLETPLRERIEYATWSEITLYFSTASFDERYANRAVERAYRHSYRQYIENWLPLDPEDLGPPLDQDPELDDYERDRLDTLRFAIKKDLDTHFVEERYDDMDISGVPKAFWLNPHEQRYAEERGVGEDAFSQSALYDFTRDP